MVNCIPLQPYNVFIMRMAHVSLVCNVNHLVDALRRMSAVVHVHLVAPFNPLANKTQST